ncbi:Male abnormal protein mab-31 [Caenorhabditis elegans]|uniref:Male abnormal protein mab-31 n=1 Tax=Caenorhabditis elegans TaxID=6239 RepID=MAB31_CAEEL|nr:Male abnormal protein mab-31 [Caenorhabditis elegans]Q9N3E2.1 RecName: Full=Male abnormal protein mab-31 [Caenorhabditis elegans]CCD72834.1 Male abnormal protein mab-31 [Caenorhabditis elegans]|eukprot:NP_491129.1 Uncharacterized protein CELE_Y54E10A.16 [Caenorhabditis elegans]
MNSLEYLIANPHILSDTTLTDALAALASSTNVENQDEEFDMEVNSDDEMKIDLSALINPSVFNALQLPIGTGRFPNPSPPRSSSGTNTPIRKTPGSRPDRGKFTILDNAEVAGPEEVLNVNFDSEILQRIFSDPKLGIQFLARYGLIPNTRVCRVQDCPKDQLMSLIKHANGFVWRCRSCRKRREKRIITKISVYEGTFLFYSRMPLNKFFIFMLNWCENPGLSITEYNRLMGENRLVEETIYNTIGFMRDIIQNWCDTIISSHVPIGGPHRVVEVVETLSTEQLSNKTRNRRTRHYTTRTVFISLADDKIKSVDFPLHNVNDLERALLECVQPGSIIVMRDSFMERFGQQEEISNALFNHYKVKSICDVWPDFNERERNKQYIKTEMNQVPNVNQEPYAYEYFFRRCFADKCFNHLLRVIRLLYQK